MNEQQTTLFGLKDWHLVPEVAVVYWQTEAEKRLVSSVEAYKWHKEACWKLLGILLPLVTFALGYVGNYYLTKGVVMWPAVGFVVVQLVGVTLLLWGLRSRRVYLTGQLPDDMIGPERVVADDVAQQRNTLLLGHCYLAQQKIMTNVRATEVCARCLNAALAVCGLLAPLAFFTLLWYS